MFRSKEAAKILGISVVTLHKWERDGYLKELTILRTPTGHRVYDEQELINAKNRIYANAERKYYAYGKKPIDKPNEL